MLLNSLVSAVLQLAAVMFLAVAAYWPLRGKARPSLVSFLGLGPTRATAVVAGAVLGAAAAAAWLAVPGMAALSKAPGSVAGEALKDGLTPVALGALVIAGVIKSALSEELFFRGLVGKRLYAWLGFWQGNVVQALVFGAVHGLLMNLLGGTAMTIGAFAAFTGVIALAAGFLNEKMGQGAIWPGWALHAAANLTTALILAFGVV